MNNFPTIATSDGWAACGYNDFAATYNAILASRRSVPLRLSRYCHTVESILESVGFSRNHFYSVGVEDCLLATAESGRRTRIIPPVQEMIESEVVDMTWNCPCDFCGKPSRSLLLCSHGLLSDYCCSEQCLRSKLHAKIRSDVSLSMMFRHRPHRQDAPLPEDAEAMAEHFSGVPQCTADNYLSDDYRAMLEELRHPPRPAMCE